MRNVIIRNIENLELDYKNQILGYKLFDKMYLLENNSFVNFYCDFFKKLDENFLNLGMDVFQMIIDNKELGVFINSKPFNNYESGPCYQFELRKNVHIKQHYNNSDKIENIKKVLKYLHINFNQLVIFYQ